MIYVFLGVYVGFAGDPTLTFYTVNRTILLSTYSVLALTVQSFVVKIIFLIILDRGK